MRGLPDGSQFDLIRQSALSFYTPITDAQARDLKALWKLAFDDVLVRSSLVACFSVIQGSTPQYGRLDSQTYGKALSALNARITTEKAGTTASLPIQVSVNFLGLMETAGPYHGSDPLTHFKALAKLIAIAQPSHLKDLPPSERSIYLLILESLAFHVTVALFSEDINSIFQHWRASRVFRLLEQINPEGPRRTAASPLLSGQYAIYELVLEVTYLHRHSTWEDIELARIDFLDMIIQKLHDSVMKDFSGTSIGCPSQIQSLFRDIYQLYLGSLSICINALRKPSRRLGDDIDAMVQEYLEIFKQVPIVKMCYAAVAWPLQILACATREEALFQQAESHIAKIKPLLDPGHQERLQRALKLAKQARQEPYAINRRLHDRINYLPPGLSLLRKKNGILS